MTAREPSAVEVISEALGKHTAEACRGVNGEPGWLCACSRPGASRWFDTEGHREHQSAEVKAAIRAMTPQQQAEVIGGEVDTSHVAVIGGVLHRRATGPWREVQS